MFFIFIHSIVLRCRYTWTGALRDSGVYLKLKRKTEETSMQGVGCLSGLFFESTCALLGASLGWFQRAMERVSLRLSLVPLRAILGMFNCVRSSERRGAYRFVILYWEYHMRTWFGDNQIGLLTLVWASRGDVNL